MSNIGSEMFGTFEFGTYEEVTVVGTFGFANAQADIKVTKNAFANAQADIKVTSNAFANAQAYIQHRFTVYAQAQADVLAIGRGFANAQGDIKVTYNAFANAQALIHNGNRGMGQAQADIRVTVKVFAQAQGRISSPAPMTGQAQAKIIASAGYFGQAMAFIGHFKYGQAQAFISGLGSRQTGQARGYIQRSTSSGPISPVNSADTTYLVRFNGYDVPGYLQQETFDSVENISTTYAAYTENSLSENIGLGNKAITLREKLIGNDYLDVKNQAQRAASILNSTRRFAKLYIQNADKYYLALTKDVAFDQDISNNGKTLDYQITFEAKPWLYDEAVQTLSGTTLVSTVGRTVLDGGWTPTVVTVTGTDVSISGYTAAGEFAGYISISGDVIDMVIDTEKSSATIGGLVRNDVINNLDYQLYVGEGVTTFEIDGATSCEIKYTKRWYL